MNAKLKGCSVKKRGVLKGLYFISAMTVSRVSTTVWHTAEQIVGSEFSLTDRK